MKLIIGVVALLAVASAAFYTEEEHQARFVDFMKQFEKEYCHEAFFYRYSTFKLNQERIAAHNERFEQGLESYNMKINQFGDLSPMEFKASMLKLKQQKNGQHAMVQKEQGIANSVDWRTASANPAGVVAVTDVKNQGQCGSCWSFSIAAGTEGAVALSGGSLVSLSEQQLVDCNYLVSPAYNMGCDGGQIDFTYIEQNGLFTYQAYPYTSGTTKHKGDCQASSLSGQPVYGNTLKGQTRISAGDKQSFMNALNNQPVSIAIEADQMAFQFYSSGILTGKCGDNLDHGVLAVGYGSDSDGDYWIVKNSWGTTWGEQGYIRLARDSDNTSSSYNKGMGQCGLLSAGAVPNLS